MAIQRLTQKPSIIETDVSIVENCQRFQRLAITGGGGQRSIALWSMCFGLRESRSEAIAIDFDCLRSNWNWIDQVLIESLTVFLRGNELLLQWLLLGYLSSIRVVVIVLYTNWFRDCIRAIQTGSIDHNTWQALASDPGHPLCARRHRLGNSCLSLNRRLISD